MYNTIETNDYGIPISNDGIMKTFNRMGIGLLITALISYMTYSSGLYLRFLYSSTYAFLGILEIAIVIIFSFAFRKLSPSAVSLLFYSYAFINGLTMGTIFAIYEMGTIFSAFLSASLLFIGLAFYGNKTQKDLTKVGTICMVTLVVGLIVSIINIFLRSSMTTIVLDWVMLLIFCGLTAYDMNKIKYMQNFVTCDQEKVYVYCAMDLYLDFINIFIRLLSIFARSNRKN